MYLLLGCKHDFDVGLTLITQATKQTGHSRFKSKVLLFSRNLT